LRATDWLRARLQATPHEIAAALWSFLYFFSLLATLLDNRFFGGIAGDLRLRDLLLILGTKSGAFVLQVSGVVFRSGGSMLPLFQQP